MSNEASPLSRLGSNQDVVPRVVRHKRSLFGRSKAKLDSFVLAQALGSGSQGRVVKATLPKGFEGEQHPREVAIKTFGHSSGAGGQEKVHRELLLHSECHDHPNIVTVHDYLQSGNNLHVVMDLANCDLLDYVARRGPLPLAQARSLLRKLASAVQHMHSHHIAHRDIKPENILMGGADDALEPLLCDFGHAVRWSEGDLSLSDVAGTTRCCPPEMFEINPDVECRTYNPKAMDMWGLGVVFFFCLTGRFPFSGNTEAETVRNILDNHLTAALPDQNPQSLSWQLLEDLLHPVASVRPTASGLLSHPFFLMPNSHSS